MFYIKERLDKVRALIQEPEFLEGKGLSNEVNIRIFCYEPENEMVVRHFVNQLETDQSLDAGRNHKTIMVVEDTRDLAAYEKTGKYDGVYHVLHGGIGKNEPEHGIKK